MEDSGDGFGSQFMTPITGADSAVMPPPGMPPVDAPPPQNGGFGDAVGSAVSNFGNGLKSLLGPQYAPAPPDASPLDRAANQLQQQSKRAESISANPVAQFFAPEKVQEARQFLPKAAEQLQKIEQQKAGITANRLEADNLGFAPGEISDYATHQDRVVAAQSRALKGNLKTFQGLQVADPKAAEAIQDQFHNAVAANLAAGQAGFDKLSNARGQSEYAQALRELRGGGSIAGLEALGLKVPDSFEKFNAVKGREAEALRNARIGVDTIGQKLEARNTAQPMEEKEAKTYKGAWKTVYGDEIEGQASRVGASGARMNVIDQYDDPRKLGRGAVLASPEQRKAIAEEVDKLVPKDEREKYRAFNRTYRLATTDAKGDKLPDGEVNTNPNVQQGMAEGLASMLRGGSGGANVGLLKIETSKRGFIQGLIDKIETEKGAAINELKGKDVNPYLSKLTQQQIRDVMDVLKQYNDKSVGERVGPAAERAGALGLNASDVGFAKGEGAAIDDAMERGRQAQIALDMRRHQSIGGGRGALLYGALTPANNAQSLPSGAEARNQLPGTGLQTPVQQATNPPPSPGSPPPGPNQPPTMTGPGGNPPAPQPGGPPAPVPTGGPTPGRTGVPPNMPLNSPEALTAAANRTIQIESGFKPGSKTGSYVGLGQWSKEEMKRHGITDPDDVEQTRAALQKDIVRRAAKLQKDGLPATPSNVYLMHQQGEAGLEAHLRNPDGPAWENIRFGFTNDAIAKRAIWGNMTDDMKRSMGLRSIDDVGKVTSGDFTRLWEARFAGTDTKPGAAGARMMAGAPAEPAIGANDRTAPRHTPGTREEPASLWGTIKGALFGRDAEAADQLKGPAIEHAPAIGSIIGAGAGTLGGPAGTIAGGAVGGAAGQSLKDYLLGNQQDPVKIAKEGALGGVLGIVPGGSAAARAAGAGIRTVGAGVIEAGAKAAEGGDLVDSAEAGLTGARDAALGEGFGRALGAAGHKIWSWFTPDAKKAVRAAAADLHEANETLKTEQPKLPGAAGAAATANPKYEAAQAAKEKAEEKIKEMLPNAKPDEVAYAHKVHAEGVPNQEAAAARPGAIEKAKIGAGYQQLESEMGRARDFRNPDRVMKDAGVRPDGKPMLEDGPMAAVATKKVSAAHAELAERTEMVITAPAKNWQEKWTQLKDVRSALLDAERDATTSTAAGRTQTAKDMRTLADTVREQQVKAAEAVFGEKGGVEVIKRLGLLDTRYARLMKATNGGDIAVAARLRGEKGREADRAFRAFAQDDHVALAAWNAMRSAGPDVERDIRTLVGVEKIPVLGHLVSAVKLAAGYNQWRADRAAGSHARFADFVPELKEAAVRERRTVRNIAGSIGARAAVN